MSPLRHHPYHGKRLKWLYRPLETLLFDSTRLLFDSRSDSTCVPSTKSLLTSHRPVCEFFLSVNSAQFWLVNPSTCVVLSVISKKLAHGVHSLLMNCWQYLTIGVHHLLYAVVCPNSSCTTLGCTLILNKRVVMLCLRSWKRISGNPVRTSNFWKQPNTGCVATNNLIFSFYLTRWGYLLQHSQKRRREVWDIYEQAKKTWHNDKNLLLLRKDLLDIESAKVAWKQATWPSAPE